MTAQLATLTAGSPVRSSPRVQRRASTGRAPGTPCSHPARAGRAGDAAIAPQYLANFAAGIKCVLQGYDGTTRSPIGVEWTTEIRNAITGQG